jgi:caffeoyl-CoA O-methyltransferase
VAEKFTPLDSDLHRYAVEYSPRDDLLRRLDAETQELGGVAAMQMAPEQGAFITLLLRAIEARRALEIGTFTGYGSISIGRGLAPDGRLITCDISEEWTGIARRYIEEAGLADRIDLRIGPALETLRGLDPDDPFDFVFIDADKKEYVDYYEESLPLLRRGGLVMVDNVFRGGDVIDPSADDDGVRAIRALNDRIAADERVDSAMIAVADGVTLARKQ